MLEKKIRPICKYFCPNCKWLSTAKPKKTFKRLCPKCGGECICREAKEIPEGWKMEAMRERFRIRQERR